MATGERIKFFRKRKGMTQKELGMMLGFSEKTADIRMAQYESEKRVPKEAVLETTAKALDVDIQALQVPDIDTYHGLMQTLFTLEDYYGIKVSSDGSDVSLTFKPTDDFLRSSLQPQLKRWSEIAEKYYNGEITKEQYDEWRYNYPASDTRQGRKKYKL